MISGLLKTSREAGSVQEDNRKIVITMSLSRCQKPGHDLAVGMGGY